jgi:hypothetical protein
LNSPEVASGLFYFNAIPDAYTCIGPIKNGHTQVNAAVLTQNHDLQKKTDLYKERIFHVNGFHNIKLYVKNLILVLSCVRIPTLSLYRWEIKTATQKRSRHL